MSCIRALALGVFLCSPSVLAGNAGLFSDASSKIPFDRGAWGLFSEGLGGAAWLDYDRDGDLDLYLTNRPFRLNGLFRNNGNGSFTNVAFFSGVANGAGNNGALAGDIDNDGCTDLFLTGEGGMVSPFESAAKLYVNNCNGTFSDVTLWSGIHGPFPGLMAAFGDIDNDGYLDLFITSPGSFFTGQQTRSKLYRNNGDRTFTDISAAAGIDTNLGACVVGFHDWNDDGWIDIYVGNCNDLQVTPTPFELFHNNGDLTFTDVAHEAGLDGGGYWMGVSFADYDRDGDLDLFSTSGGTSMMGNPYHALYRDNGDDTYTDVGVEAGVGVWEFGWGASFVDVDNDGDEDLFFTGSFPPFGMIGPGGGNPGRLFLQDGNGSFSMEQSFGLESRYSSGVAVADYDGDGFSDVVVVKSRKWWLPGRPLLLRNKGNDNHWLTVRLVGTTSNRDGVGARVRVVSGELSQLKLVTAGTSFLSTNSPWLNFGLGHREVADVEVTWPSGLRESFPGQSVDRMVTLVEGSGSPLP